MHSTVAFSQLSNRIFNVDEASRIMKNSSSADGAEGFANDGAGCICISKPPTTVPRKDLRSRSPMQFWKLKEFELWIETANNEHIERIFMIDNNFIVQEVMCASLRLPI